MQPSIFDLHPEELEQPFDYGDYVTGSAQNGGTAQGYICELGIKWLILSAVPRCGWKQNGPGLDYGNLPCCGFIAKATARRIPSPDQQTEIF